MSQPKYPVFFGFTTIEQINREIERLQKIKMEMQKKEIKLLFDDTNYEFKIIINGVDYIFKWKIKCFDYDKYYDKKETVQISFYERIQEAYRRGESNLFVMYNVLETPDNFPEIDFNETVIIMQKLSKLCNDKREILEFFKKHKLVSSHPFYESRYSFEDVKERYFDGRYFVCSTKEFLMKHIKGEKTEIPKGLLNGYRDVLKRYGNWKEI